MRNGCLLLACVAIGIGVAAILTVSVIERVGVRFPEPRGVTLPLTPELVESEQKDVQQRRLGVTMTIICGSLAGAAVYDILMRRRRGRTRSGRETLSKPLSPADAP